MSRQKQRKGIDWIEDKKNAATAKKFTLSISGDYLKFEWKEGFLPSEEINSFEKAKARADEIFEGNERVSSVTVATDNGVVVYGRTMGSFGSCP